MIYVMSDFHLPSTLNKQMDIFGWGDHVKKIEEQWPLSGSDTIVIPGDLSWALKTYEAEPDLKWLSELPGKKILLKGNHDIWCSSYKKMREIEEQYQGIYFIHNTSITVEGISICGSRGWDIISEEEADKKIVSRESIRLKLSLDKAETDNIVCFMHYPPLMHNCDNEAYHKIFLQYGIHKVFFGHLHGEAYGYGFQGERDGIEYRLISADYLGFKPIAII